MFFVVLTKINFSPLLKQKLQKPSGQNLAISAKVFFLCKFDEGNTNCCRFKQLFRELTVKLQIKCNKKIRVLQGVRLPIYLASLIPCASQFEERGSRSIHFVICKH